MTFDRSSQVVFGNVMRNIMDDPMGLWSSSGVVERWTNPDPSTWILYLRDGLRFQDGRPLTAADVAASIERVRTERASPLHGFVQDVASVNVESPTTLRLVIAGPVNVLWRLASIPVTPGGEPVPPDGLPVGGGPYRISSWGKNRITLERVTATSVPSPAPRQIQVMITPDEKDQEEVAGSVRPLIMIGPRPPILDHAEELGLRLMSAETRGALYLVCNLRPGRPLASLEARRALAAACFHRIHHPVAQRWREADDIIPGSVFGHVDGRFEPRPEWAIGNAIPKDPLKLLVIDTLKSISDEVAGCLKKAGWPIEVVTLPAKSAMEALGAGEFDLAVVGYDCSSGSALELFALAFSSHGGYVNLSGYRNPRLDAIVEEASCCLDPAVEQGLLVEAGDTVVADLPWIPLFYVNLNYLISPGVHLSEVAAQGIDFSRVRIGS